MQKPPSLRALLVGTRLEGPARYLRWLLNFPQRRKHPELWGIYLEEIYLPRVLHKLMKPDSIAVDIGAHIGSFISLLLRVAPQGKHIAFEASTNKGAWLKNRFRDVDVYSVAVSDKDGTALFQENLHLSGFSRLSDRPDNDDSVSYTVETRRLDSILGARKVDLIKIDVEGLELSVLRGAREVIEKCRPPILFECGAEYALQDLQISRLELFNFLTQDLSYSISTYADFLFEKGPMNFDEFRRCGLYPFVAFNFIALPL